MFAIRVGNCLEEQVVFSGRYYNSIDSKNRTIVPQKFREQLGGLGCMITRGRDKCIEIYPYDDWEALQNKYENLPESDPRVRDFISDFFGSAQNCVFDKQGRIVIPQHLIDFAKIDKELITEGAMKKAKIWSKELFEGPRENRRLSEEESYDSLLEYGI